jgi:signal transduction histidine kinase
MSRKISLAAAESFPEKAYELFRSDADSEAGPLYRAAEEKVRQLGLKGAQSRTVILAMLYPMKPSGSSRFISAADGRRCVEFHVIPPDNSLRIAGFDYLGYRGYISPMAREYCTLLAIISGIILIGFRFFFFQAITHPLQLIEEGITAAKKGDLSVKVPVIAEDEIGLIARTFNAMMNRIAESESNLEEKVRDRTVQLEDTNRELTSALTLLKSTQEDLVRREKMAALGDMVAGIAHEINTPVGVALTAGTYLSNRTAVVKNEIEKGNLSRSGFDSFIASSAESASIITSNLTRAAELVNSFKKVAVAQTSGEISEFKLERYLRDLLLNLRPALKRTKISTVISCDENLTVTTYAGAISQIVTNLVMNSINHGFDSGSEGIISMTANTEGESLLFRYSDSGKGIPAEIIAKIFDPFFTTARKTGGTGLGLHIVYNLVTQKLNGTISVESAPGQGTTFLIRVPLRSI